MNYHIGRLVLSSLCVGAFLDVIFLDHCTRRGEGSASRLGRSLPAGKTRNPLDRKLSGPLGPVWTGAENLVPIGIRSPDRPARSQSLYRLSYRAHTWLEGRTKLLKLGRRLHCEKNAGFACKIIQSFRAWCLTSNYSFTYFIS